MAAAPSSTPGSNVIYYQLVLDAADFITKLSEAQRVGLTFDQNMALIKTQIQDMMNKFNIDPAVAARVLQALNAELNTTQSITDRIQTNAAFQQVTKNMNDANIAGISLESTLRMIEGVIVSMVVFRGIQFLSQMFTDAVKDANNYYLALQNITAAQSALAQAGIAVTNQQMLDIADQLQQKWHTISQVDITAAVAQAGLMASEYRLSVDQMTQLANEAAILHQLDPSKPMAEYVTQLARALENGRSLAANGEQIAITTDETLAKAKELGLVSADAKSVTDSHVKAVANLAIEYDRLAPEQQKLLDNENGLLGTQQTLAGNWSNWLKDLGTLLSPVIVTVEKFAAIWFHLTDIQQQYNQLVAALVDILGHLSAYGAMYAYVWNAANEALHGHFTALSQLPGIWSEILSKSEAYYNNLFKYGGTNLSNTQVNPNAEGTGTTTPPVDDKKITSILDTVSKDYQNYYDSMQKDAEAFNTKMQDLQDRYNLDVQREEQNANLRMSNERADYHLKEEKQEQDFRQKMKDLQAKYLLDLEDGLRKQDAEAVIKTMEKYQLEKNTAEQQNNLKLEQDSKEEQLKLSQMKEQEKLRLSQMKAEFDLQQTEAKRAYDQQITDLTRSLNAKLQEEAVKAQQELGLNTNSIDSIYSLFQDYYGPDGKFAKSQQGAYTKMIEQSQGFVDGMTAIYNQFFGNLSAMTTAMSTMTGPIVGSTNTGSYRGGGGTSSSVNMNIPRHQAEGGVALAASATDVTFGEAGPELAMFLPLNSAGGGASASALGGLGAVAGGQVLVALQLSPDLEARIVNTTLTHAAISIQKVYGAG